MTTTARKPMTNDEAWEFYRNLDKYLFRLVRQAASRQLSIEYAGSGHGIGSSDINHRAVSMIKATNGMPSPSDLMDILEEYDEAVAIGRIQF